MTVTVISPALIALFDLLIDLPPTYSCLWAEDHPHLESTLRHWAAQHGYPVAESITEGGHVIEVVADNYRRPIRARLDAAAAVLEQAWRPTDEVEVRQ